MPHGDVGGTKIPSRVQEEYKFGDGQQLLNSIERRLKEIPYKEPIQIMMKMKKIGPPLNKARCIVEMSSSIVHSINAFWDGIDVNKDKLTIDGDSLLMIYIYTTVKADFVDLFA